MSEYKWDPGKARINVHKHGITFEEADSAVSSPLAAWSADIRIRDRDVRRRVVGWSSEGRLLVVIVSVSDQRPAIISARRATKRERDAYTNR
ncbi:MAG: BrnT family toxin [Candidatus Limnocylindrales bacterium]